MKIYISLFVVISLFINFINCSEIKNIKTIDEFEKLKSNEDLPIMIDFFAPSCVQCKKFNSIFDKLSIKYKEKILFIKINTDEAEELSDLQNILTLPTIFFIYKKQILGREFNFKTEEQMESYINKYFKLKSNKQKHYFLHKTF